MVGVKKPKWCASIRRFDAAPMKTRPRLRVTQLDFLNWTLLIFAASKRDAQIEQALTRGDSTTIAKRTFLEIFARFEPHDGVRGEQGEIADGR